MSNKCLTCNIFQIKMDSLPLPDWVTLNLYLNSEFQLKLLSLISLIILILLLLNKNVMSFKKRLQICGLICLILSGETVLYCLHYLSCCFLNFRGKPTKIQPTMLWFKISIFYLNFSVFLCNANLLNTS